MAELGRDVSGRVVPPVSMVEYAMAVAVLDRKPIPDGVEAWIERWQRARWIDDDLVLDERHQLAFTATVGRKHRLKLRPGSRAFKTNLSPRAVCDRIVAAGPSMMTGSYSARRFTDAAVPWGVQMYVPDPEATEAMLEPTEDGALTVWLLSAATNMIGDDEMGDGIEMGLASFWRTVIDCYGGAKRMPEQADWMLEEQWPDRWGVRPEPGSGPIGTSASAIPDCPHGVAAATQDPARARRGLRGPVLDRVERFFGLAFEAFGEIDPRDRDRQEPVVRVGVFVPGDCVEPHASFCGQKGG